jgi:hypothetical protein
VHKTGFTLIQCKPIAHPQPASSPVFKFKFTGCPTNILPAVIHFLVEFVVFEVQYFSLLLLIYQFYALQDTKCFHNSDEGNLKHRVQQRQMEQKCAAVAGLFTNVFFQPPWEVVM